MSAKPIDRLEAQMEALIEGLFTRLFQPTTTLRDLAILLLRVMADKAIMPTPDDPRPIAPDAFIIILHPDDLDRLRQQSPDYLERFQELLVALANETGYRLLRAPSIDFRPGELGDDPAPRVLAEHSHAALGETKAAPAITTGLPRPAIQAPLLVFEDDRAIELENLVITIGREADNDIVLDDAYVSRFHLQLRKQFGRYTLFDLQSRGGTRVNNTAVSEHVLQSGDRIQIGHTCLTYVDRAAQALGDGTTQILVPE